MGRFACKACGYSPKIPPRKAKWACPKCGKKVILRKKKAKATVRIKKDEEVEKLLEPLDPTHLPPPREKLFLFQQKSKNDD
ncbi:MAG: hypothetical protein ACE5OZ_25515 [Candidatus Heimdallarchaeota archaeon]